LQAGIRRSLGEHDFPQIYHPFTAHFERSLAASVQPTPRKFIEPETGTRLADVWTMSGPIFGKYA
jgi:hypothetical protein